MKLAEVRKKYDRFSFFYDLVDYPLEKLIFEPWRRKALPQVTGKVLEIGVGTGKNLPFYDYTKAHVTALDISEKMIAKAQNVAHEGQYPVHFVLNTKNTLPFKNNSFDCIVTSCVLCSVPDQIQMILEMKRVLKKNGKLVMLEHMLSENKLLALLEHIHNPISRFLLGVNVNRPTVKNLKKCGLKLIKKRNVALYDIFKSLEAQK